MRKPALIGRVESEARHARHVRFVRLLSGLQRPLSILDVGGSYDYWQQLGCADLGEVRVTLLNTYVQPDLPAPFVSVVGDARDLSRYADYSFDVVFSNSVIGHVGTFVDQQRMAAELRRVGRRYFVQTPNQGFPIDWRTLVPFFHFLPATAQAWCFHHFRVGAYERVADRAQCLNLATRIRNIRWKELAVLFPGAVVVAERFFGLTKSFMIHGGFGNPK
jgi:hypothetical protein